jgi:hypothetical protein
MADDEALRLAEAFGLRSDRHAACRRYCRTWRS